jgi:hypothetical protein
LEGVGSTHGGTSRAVSMSMNGGNTAVFRVRADRFDNQVEFIGAVDLACDAVGHIGPDELGFREVIEPVNALGIAVPHKEHGVRRVFRPRDEDEVIGAEVEHEGQKGRERKNTPACTNERITLLSRPRAPR